MLTVPSKATPAEAIPSCILDLGFAPLHCQVEVAVIGVDAMLDFRPQEDLDGMIVYKDRFPIFCHGWFSEGRRR